MCSKYNLHNKIVTAKLMVVIERFGTSSVAVGRMQATCSEVTPAFISVYNSSYVPDMLAMPKEMISEF